MCKKEILGLSEKERRKMILDRVTVTGADDSTRPEDLIELSIRFPFVEWGILFSKSSEGSFRFPTRTWIQSLINAIKERKHSNTINLSGHICGRWVRDICEGNWTIVKDKLPMVPDLSDILHSFQRFQLNFHAQVHNLNREKFFYGGIEFLQVYNSSLIFQMDNVNNSLLDEAKKMGIIASPLFDLSGGAGILPSYWPEAKESYTGYAGGLSPDNVAEQIEKIKLVAGDSRIWIDVERRVRSEDDSKLDLDKVTRFLEVAEPFVVNNRN